MYPQRFATPIFRPLALVLRWMFHLPAWECTDKGGWGSLKPASTLVKRSCEALSCKWGLEGFECAFQPHHFESEHLLHNTFLSDCVTWCRQGSTCPQTCHCQHDNAPHWHHRTHNTFQKLPLLAGYLLMRVSIAGGCRKGKCNDQ